MPYIRDLTVCLQIQDVMACIPVVRFWSQCMGMIRCWLRNEKKRMPLPITSVFFQIIHFYTWYVTQKHVFNFRLCHIVPLVQRTEEQMASRMEGCVAADENLCRKGRADSNMVTCVDCQRPVHRSCLCFPESDLPTPISCGCMKQQPELLSK